VTRDRLAAPVVFGVAFVAALLPTAVHAFSDPKIYGDRAETGGGGGRWFTGSPAEGYGCAVCHAGGGEVPLNVTGLPADGYVPGTPYIVKLNWAQVAAFSAAAEQRGLRPVSSLVAEFVGEDGNGAGDVTLEPNFAMPAEQCKKTSAADPTRFAATMFNSTAPSADVLECSTSQKNQRCIVGTYPCGSSELRIKWKAPSQWRGPIWFSAGFVTTENATGVPNDNDFVTELVVPMNAKSDGPLYETTLDAGCSVLRVEARPSSGAALYVLTLLGLLGRRRSVRAWTRRSKSSRAAAWLAALCCLVAVGCRDDNLSSARLANVGLYTPGDAGAVDSGAEPMLGCMNPPLPQSADDAGVTDLAGSLSIAFATNLPHGNYDLEVPQPFWNAGVVWIEDDKGHYVKTLEYWKAVKFPLAMKGYLFKSLRYNCPLDMDVVATATLRAHQAHMAMWNGKDANGHVVPDGNYKLMIEVQIDETHIQPINSVPFMKGRTPSMQSPADGSLTGLMGVTLTYTPAK
jgi:hypothetical protein